MLDLLKLVAVFASLVAATPIITSGNHLCAGDPCLQAQSGLVACSRDLSEILHCQHPKSGVTNVGVYAWEILRNCTNPYGGPALCHMIGDKAACGGEFPLGPTPPDVKARDEVNIDTWAKENRNTDDFGDVYWANMMSDNADVGGIKKNRDEEGADGCRWC